MDDYDPTNPYRTETQRLASRGLDERAGHAHDQNMAVALMIVGVILSLFALVTGSSLVALVMLMPVLIGAVIYATYVLYPAG